jgi:hypothetical protein
MRRTTAKAVLLAMMCSSAALPAAAQEQSLEGLVGEARDSSGAAAGAEISEAEPFSEEELNDLVAPVALYPDALLAQVLVASTFPLQIVKADRILDRSEEMSDDELAAAVEAQDWDPSVLVLLSGFPTVVQRMADDLEQTEQLGLAMAQQDQDVLAAVQRMRARAEDTGYLEDNAAQVVEHRGDYVAIEPADPDVIYVPRYDPGVAFTSPPTRQPVIAPSTGTSLMRDPLVAGAIAFGSALLIDQLFGDDDEDDDGWDDYWHRARPIDWGARQIYPRPYRWRADNRWRDIAWSQERDRYWDRQAHRWRREAEEARRAAWRERREARAWEVWRDPNTGATRLRPRDWRDAEARLDARRMRQEAAERREAAERKAVQERRQQAAERRDRREAREARQQRQDAAERKAAQERRERRERRDAAEARQARQEAAQRREAAERRRAAAEREERQQAAQRAAEERRKQQAAAERDRRERAAAERQRAERAERQRREAAQREAAQRERVERAERQRREAAQREAAQRARAERAERQRREAAQRQAAQREQAERAERQQREAARRAAQQQQAEEREAQRRAQRRDCSDADSARERRACRQRQ